MAGFDDAHVQHFGDHGFVLIERFLAEGELERARPGLWDLYPTAEDFHAGRDARAERYRDPDFDATPAFRRKQFEGLREFPFRHQPLNRLALHPELIRLAEALLGTRDVRLYQAETYAKYTGATSYEQPLHVDYTNHVMLPPRSDGRFRQVQLFLYLTEVTEAHGPTHVVSRRYTRGLPLFPQRFDSPAPPRLEHLEVSAAGPAGSLLAYAADVLHRGTDMTLRGGARFFFNLAFRPAGADWVGGNPWPRRGIVPGWTELVEGLGPRPLEVLGFPPPGHPYWNPETLAGAADRYPGLDLAPWRAALVGRG
jgi:hypothetical protein